jgi:virginiamycin B lyase
MGRSRRIPGLALCLTAGAAIWAPGASAEPVGLVEHLPTGCAVGRMVAGNDGNIWFTCLKSGRVSAARGEIARITPQGQVTEFSAGIPPNTEPTDIAVGPDGNIWFTVIPEISLHPRRAPPAAIGRLTPDGQVTLFSAGLGSAPGGLTVAPDGNLWFLDNTGGGPAVGRITPQGAITEFPTGLREGILLNGLVVGADGNLWSPEVFDLPRLNGDPPVGVVIRIAMSGAITEFGSVSDQGVGFPGPPAAGPDGNVWFVGISPHSAIDRVTPDGQIAEFSAGIGPGRLPGPVVTGADQNLWFPTRGLGNSSGIARITPSGAITEFSQCMNYRLLFSGPTSLTAGPDGNLWFTSQTSRNLPYIAEPPTIGRITPAGQITQFREGLQSEPGSILAGPDGRVWFGGGANQIERITPSSAPVNTFIAGPSRPADAKGSARVGIELPGPGTLTLRQIGLLLPHRRLAKLPGPRLIDATATSCGTSFVRLRARGRAKTRLMRRGRIQEKFRATFTPTGGTPYTRPLTLELRRRVKR